MSDRLPFDPAPRSGEVEAIVARARRRKALRAAVPVSSAAVVAAVLALNTGSTSHSLQELEVADDPTGAVSTSTVPASASALPAGRNVQPAPSPTSLTVPQPPGGYRSPTPSPTSQRPAGPGGRRAYQSELGPRVEEYGYPACRQRQLTPGSRAVTHAGFCVEPVFTAPTGGHPTNLAPGLRICWQSETVYSGWLDFPTQEDLDFALYEADVDGAGRTVVGRRVYRFSDAVTYKQRSHRLRVLQGDCMLWQGRLDFDPSRSGGGTYLLRVHTPTTALEPAHRTYDVTFGSGAQ